MLQLSNVSAESVALRTASSAPTPPHHPLISDTYIPQPRHPNKPISKISPAYSHILPEKSPKTMSASSAISCTHQQRVSKCICGIKDTVWLGLPRKRRSLKLASFTTSALPTPMICFGLVTCEKVSTSKHTFSTCRYPGRDCGVIACRILLHSRPNSAKTSPFGSGGASCYLAAFCSAPATGCSTEDVKRLM